MTSFFQPTDNNIHIPFFLFPTFVAFSQSFVRTELATDNGTGYLDWCTVAPSDGEFYNGSAIRQRKNSLLVTTLEDGSQVDREVYIFHLNENGTGLLRIFPNPSNNEVSFLSNDKIVQVELFDHSGRKVLITESKDILSISIEQRGQGFTLHVSSSWKTEKQFKKNY